MNITIPIVTNIIVLTFVAESSLTASYVDLVVSTPPTPSFALKLISWPPTGLSKAFSKLLYLPTPGPPFYNIWRPSEFFIF